MGIRRFKDIEVWRLGRELTKEVYSLTVAGEFSKDFGLKDQVRRAAGSLMHNIAEGFDAGGNTEFVRFLLRNGKSISSAEEEARSPAETGFEAPAPAR